MQYSDDYLREFLPRENPPFGLVPTAILQSVEGKSELLPRDDDRLVDRSRFWTHAMFSELALGQVRLHGFRSWRSRLAACLDSDVIIGLYDGVAEKPGFGISVNILMSDDSGFEEIGHVEFLRLKRKFPFALRSTVSELHAATNPSVATAACWAKSNSKGNWGIITAAHAFDGLVAGAKVGFDDGSSGILEPHFYQPIDAALILTAAPTTLPTALPVMSFPTSGDPVTVFARSGSHTRTVVAVGNPLGFYKTRSFPVLFFLDNPCVGGDSGALIRLKTGEACGIYCGSEPAPDTGGVTGRALNFAQAMFALDVSPYI